MAAQSYEWGGSFGGDGEDVVLKMHVDAAGNSYTTGYFSHISDFDISGEEYLLAAGEDFDIFVQKTNPDGQLLWAKKMGGTSFDYATDIVADANGNVYVTGVYEGIADFDPGRGEYLLESTGGLDIFIVKLDVNGDFLWAKSIGGPEYEESVAIGIDAPGNVYVSGYFYADADFDPGTAEFNMETTGFGDGFIVKLSTEGIFTWAKQFGGADFDLALNMKVTAEGDSYIVGNFRETADFDPDPVVEFSLVAAEGNDAGYLLHLDADGRFISAAKTGDATSGLFPMDVDRDTVGNIYITGYFGGDMAVGNVAGNETVLHAPDFYNGFILKIDAAGSTDWATQLTGDEASMVYGVAVSPEGEIMVTGYFSGMVQLGTLPLTIVSEGAMESFFGKLDANGNFTAANQFGGINFVDKCAIGIDAENNIYLSGAYEIVADLNPDANGFDMATSKGYRDNYLIKMAAAPLSVKAAEGKIALSVYPNPTHGFVNLKASAPLYGETWKLVDLSGRKVGNGVLTASQQISLDDLANGTYILSLSGNAIKIIKE